MKVKVSVVLILISFCISQAYAQIKPSKKELEKIYRQYVLERCVYFAFGEQKVFSGDISASVYYAAGDEFGSTNHSRMLDSLAKKKLSTITVTQIEDYEGAKPILMDCIDYYDSKELKEEIRKILAIPRESEMLPPKQK